MNDGLNDLSALEQAFSADARAFAPLTRAYLQRNRLMEAMVVCRKGIKAIPDSVEGKLLLAQIYAEQGKVPKAIEEVQQLLESAPQNAEANFVLAGLQDKAGRFEEAIESYKKTLQADRHHDGARAALKAKGIDFNPGPSAEELAAAAQAEADARAAADRAALEAQQAAIAAQATQAMPAARGRSSSLPSMGAVSTPPVAAPVDPAFAQMYAQTTLMGYQGPEQKKRGNMGVTALLAAVLLLGVVGFVGGLAYHRRQQDQVKEFLVKAQALVRKDTTRGHKAALPELRSALKIDDGQDLAVSQYAYSMGVLADRGVMDLPEARDIITAAREAAEVAAKKAKDHPLSVAARMMAYRREGKLDEAAALGANIEAPLVQIELGRVYAAQGKISELIKLADGFKGSEDVRVLSFAADAYRRIGDGFKARKSVDESLKRELDHDPSRALRALLILEQDDVTNLAVALDDVQSLLDLGKDALGNRERGYATLGRALIAKRTRGGKEVDRDIEAARGMLGRDAEMPMFDAQQEIVAASAKPGATADDWKRAQELLEQAIKVDRFRLAPYLALVEVGARAKNFAVAEKAHADALQIFGDNLSLGLSHGQLQIAAGKTDEALASLDALSKKFDIAEVYRDMGKVYMKKEDLPKAVELLKKAAEKAGARSVGVQANVYTWLGRALYQGKSYAEAKEAYAQALRATPEFTSTYYWLGLTLAELDEGAAAKDALKRYIDAEPTGAYVEKAKAKLADM
jgi:cellulose synthase operon protein C